MAAVSPPREASRVMQMHRFVRQLSSTGSPDARAWEPLRLGGPGVEGAGALGPEMLISTDGGRQPWWGVPEPGGALNIYFLAVRR